MQRADGDGGEELVPVGEVPVGRGHGHADTAAQLGDREASHSSFGDQLNGTVDQRGFQVAVVVPPSLSSCHSRPVGSGRGHVIAPGVLGLVADRLAGAVDREQRVELSDLARQRDTGEDLGEECR
jgi:hypothetical protein